MATNIVLKLEVDGTKQAVRSIDDLETAIEQLNTQLRASEIGSEQYKNLARELQNAQSELKNLEKGFEGLEPQQKVESFVLFGEGVAGAFVAAQSALQLFNIESEEVAEAQLKIQAAIGIALGARQIAEAALQVQVIKNTIAQQAYNASLVAGNTITRTFFATIAANPIGALVTAIGLAVTGFIAYKSSVDDAYDSQEELNKVQLQASKETEIQIDRIQFLSSVINDNTREEKLRLEALEEIKKIIPDIGEVNLDNEESLRKLNERILQNIELLTLQAEQQALQSLLQESLEDKYRVINDVQQGNATILERITGLLTGQNTQLLALNRLNEEGQEILRREEFLKQQLIRINERILKLQAENNAENEEGNKLKEDQQKIERELAKVQSDRNNIIQDQIQTLKDLGEEIRTDYAEPQILSDLRAIANELERLGKIEPTFSKLVEDTFAQPPVPPDVFGRFYESVRGELSNALFTIPTDNVDQFQSKFQSIVNKILFDAIQLLEENEITPEAFQSLQQLTDGYVNLSDLILQTPSLRDQLLGDFGDIESDLDRTTGQLGSTLSGFGSSLAGVSADFLKEVKEFFDDDVETFEKTTNTFDLIRQQLISQGDIQFRRSGEAIKEIELAEENLDNLLVNQIQFEENRKRLLETIKQGYSEQLAAGEITQEQVNQIAEAQLTSILDLITNITKEEETIRGVLFEAETLTTQINKIQATSDSPAFRNFVLENTELLAQQVDVRLDLQERYFGNAKRLSENYLAIEQELLKLNINLEDFTQEERLKIIKAFYEEKERLRKQDEEKEIIASQTQKDSFQSVFNNVLEIYNQVSNTLDELGRTFLNSIDQQLVSLQQREEGLLNKIVGDSEEANQKRLEVQREYERERERLTKQQTLIQLELSRIQAIANVAEAVSKALASGPIIGQVLAGVSAALGAVQVGVITQQIGEIRNLAGGGLLQGPAHEQGGVYMGGGIFAEGGEMVINRQSSMMYGDLLSSINQVGSTRPIVQGVGEERLLEAIAKTKREPIRAYVLEQDITKSQSINKRLETLSKI